MFIIGMLLAILGTVKAMVDELLIKYPGATITISNNGFTPYPGMPENVIQIDRFPKLESRMAQLEFFIVLLFKGKRCGFSLQSLDFLDANCYTMPQ